MSIKSSSQLTSKWEVYKRYFIENNKINSMDTRGWYITESNGVYYLYKDGIIRIGTYKDKGNAFWKTKKDAEDFFNKWKEGKI